MPRFAVWEEVTCMVYVEADTAQDALDAWLSNGKDAITSDGMHEEVTERWVNDDKGNACEVEDQ